MTLGHRRPADSGRAAQGRLVRLLRSGQGRTAHRLLPLLRRGHDRADHASGQGLKEGSDGRFYTRPMAGYQPGGPHFRFQVRAPCGLRHRARLPVDRRVLHAQRLPRARTGRVHRLRDPRGLRPLHGKTYITEIDDATHPHARLALHPHGNAVADRTDRQSARSRRRSATPRAPSSKTGPMAGGKTRRRWD